MSTDPILHFELVKKEYPIGTEVVFIEIDYTGIKCSGVLRPQKIHAYYSLDMVGIGIVALSYKAFFIKNSPVQLLRNGMPYSIYCKIEDFKEAKIWLTECWKLKVEEDRAAANKILDTILSYTCVEMLLKNKKYDLYLNKVKIATKVSETTVWLKLAEHKGEALNTGFYVTYHGKTQIAEHFTPF
jgi:hypothetical protein